MLSFKFRFFWKSVLNMWQSQVTAIFNEILEQSVHSAKKPDFSQKLIRPHKEAPMHSFHTDTHQKCSCSGPILVTYLCFHLGTRPVIGWKLQEASLFKVNSAQGQTTVCVAKDDLDLVNFLSLPPRYWDYRQSHPVYGVQGREPRASRMVGHHSTN